MKFTDGCSVMWSYGSLPARGAWIEIVRKAEYGAYNNEDLNYFVRECVGNNVDIRKDYLLSNKVSKDLAMAIKDLTDVDVSNYKNTLGANAINHILKGHGENGISDHSMKDLFDIAKMTYAIENWDTMVLGEKSKEIKNSDGSRAQTVVMKTIIGDKFYYVVEAVPDSKRKSLQVVSAYINKADSQSEVPRRISRSRLYVQNELLQSESATNSVADNKQMSRRTESIYENVGEKEKLNKRMSLMQDEINVLRERLKRRSLRGERGLK